MESLWGMRRKEYQDNDELIIFDVVHDDNDGDNDDDNYDDNEDDDDDGDDDDNCGLSIQAKS